MTEWVVGSLIGFVLLLIIGEALFRRTWRGRDDD